MDRDMKAFRLVEGADRPALVDVAVPEPGDGQVLVRIGACGLNFADRLMIDGRYQDTPERPFTMGMELAGTVVDAAEGVTGVSVGDRVAVFSGQGGLAEYGVFDEASCARIPASMSFEQAAAFQVAYGTSHLALDRRARLQPGETLLVLGASGGVGLTAVEIGKAMGAKVIAVARGAEKLAVARAAGADILMDSDTADLKAEVRAQGGADVVYDPVGGKQFDAALRACNPEARILTIGFASGSVPSIPANILLVKNLSVLGLYWGGYLRFNAAALTGSLAQLFAMFEAGRLSPHISHVFPLARADEAIIALESRKATGKIVVSMG